MFGGVLWPIKFDGRHILYGKLTVFNNLPVDGVPIPFVILLADLNHNFGHYAIIEIAYQTFSAFFLYNLSFTHKKDVCVCESIELNGLERKTKVNYSMVCRPFNIQ